MDRNVLELISDVKCVIWKWLYYFYTILSVCITISYLAQDCKMHSKLPKWKWNKKTNWDNTLTTVLANNTLVPFWWIQNFLFDLVMNIDLYLIRVVWSAFSALTHCWLGGRKGIRPVKNWVVGCWHGYLSGARCRLAYGPADATATHCLLLQ